MRMVNGISAAKRNLGKILAEVNLQSVNPLGGEIDQLTCLSL